jgi:hypothetical protein
MSVFDRISAVSPGWRANQPQRVDHRRVQRQVVALLDELDESRRGIRVADFPKREHRAEQRRRAAARRIALLSGQSLVEHLRQDRDASRVAKITQRLDHYVDELRVLARERQFFQARPRGDRLLAAGLLDSPPARRRQIVVAAVAGQVREQSMVPRSLMCGQLLEQRGEQRDRRSRRRRASVVATWTDVPPLAYSQRSWASRNHDRRERLQASEVRAFNDVEEFAATFHLGERVLADVLRQLVKRVRLHRFDGLSG